MVRFLLVVMLALVGCGEGTLETNGVDSAGAGLSENACHYKCNTCPAHKFCTMECTMVGNCGSRCTVMARCIEGYTWDDKACTCIPTAGEPCGGSVCGAGQFCCNASCGICAPIGGMCTQQVCGGETL